MRMITLDEEIVEVFKKHGLIVTKIECYNMKWGITATHDNVSKSVKPDKERRVRE